MSLKQASRIFKSLNESQRKFIDDKTISAELQIREWTGFLRKAALYDEMRDKAIKSLNIYIILSAVGVVFSGIMISSSPAIGLVLLVISIALLTYFIIDARKISKRNLSDQLRLFVLPLLFVLDKKAGEKAKMPLKMDLSNPLKKKPVKEFEQGGRKIKLFSQQYALGKVKLLDEAELEWVLSDDIQQLSYWKTNPRGKRKHKVKHKVSHYYFIKISFPKKYYETKNGADKSVRLSEDELYYICKLKVKRKSMDPKAVVSLEDFLKSINELYELIKAKPGSRFPEEVEKSQLPKKEAEDMDDDDMDDDFNAVPFMVWHHVYFTDHDYDAFVHEGAYAYEMDEGDDSFFDS